MRTHIGVPGRKIGQGWQGAIGAALLLAAPPLLALDFDLGIDGLFTSLTTDFRYNLGQRIEPRDPAVLNSVNYDESDSRFDEGDIVTNRLDATPQFELKYESEMEWLQDIGIRASGNVFRDYAYDDDRLSCRPGTAPVATPAAAPGGMFVPATKFPDDTPPRRVSYCDPRVLSYSSGRFNREAKETTFQGGEWLEGFAFGSFWLGEFPLSLKAGRHALLWGEALLSPVLGVGYSMGPLDLNKAFAVPGATAQDVLRPINQISGTAGISDTVSVGFQTFLEWQGFRMPEGGTYLGLIDVLNHGPDQFFITNLPVQGPLAVKHYPDVPGDNRRKFGVQVKWSPDFMDGGTFGLYYREFDDILPWLALVPNPNNPAIPAGYRLVFPRDMRLYGFSLSKKVFDISIGADVAYVPNRALTSQNTLADESGQRARGKVWSGVVNAIYLGDTVTVPFTEIALWDASALIAELNWSYLDEVTQRPETFKAVGSAACKADIRGALGPDAPGEIQDGCVNRYSIGAGVVFMPNWFQVFSGIDLNGAVAYSVGIKNNSPTAFGGNEGTVLGKVSLGATFYNTVSATLSYNFYDNLFRRSTNLDGEPVVGANNGLANISDRDWVSLTLKYSL